MRSDELIRRGIDMHGKEQYEEALKYYYKVDMADTNYLLMLYEAGLTYYQMQNYEKAISYFEKVMNKQPHFGFFVYTALGSSYDDMGFAEKAVKIFKKGLEKYPHNHLLHYNLGLTYYRMNKHEKSLDYIKKTLALDPYHLNSHNLLGKIAASQGHVTHAMMSWTTYLLIRPQGNVSRNILLQLERLCEGSLTMDLTWDGPKNLTPNSFSELDFIINSKVALNPNYRTPVKVDAALVKQIKLMLEKFEYEESDNDFWMNFYGPFFQVIKENNFYEPLVYYILNSAHIDEVNKWKRRIRNQNRINEFVDKTDAYIEKNRALRTVEIDGEEMALKVWYYDGRLVALGNAVDDDPNKRIGYWQIYYYNNGNLNLEGRYNENHKSEGEWKVYNEYGQIDIIEQYNEEGLLHGKVVSFYDNGQVYSEIEFENGNYNGDVMFYYYCGARNQKSFVKDGALDGVSKNFSYKDTLIEKGFYKDGQPEGSLVTYHNNGVIKSRAFFENGMHNGTYKEFNNEGLIVTQGTTKENAAVGEWRYFFNDGKLNKIENFNDKGDLHGKTLTFDKDSVLTNERKYNNGTLLWEKIYDHDGLLWNYLEYGSDETFNRIIYYDKQGQEIANYRTSSGTNNVTGYLPTGEKRFEGTIISGKRTGKWTYYFKNGVKETKHHFLNNKENGLMKDYYIFGLLYKKGPFKDGQKHGYFKTWFRNGYLSSEGWYENGQRHGLWKFYYPDGSLKDKMFYIDNQVYGPSRNYSPTGLLSNIFDSRDGKVYNITYYDTTGRTISSNTFEDGNGQLRINYPNGNKRFSVNIECGNFEGEAEWFFNDGSTESKFNFFHGQREGPYVSYYKNGDMRSKGQYKNGLQHGAWHFYFEEHSDQISRKGVYEQDDRVGVWYWYWPNNEKRMSITYHDGNWQGPYRLYDNTGALMVEYLFENDDIMSYRYKQMDESYTKPYEAHYGNIQVEAYYSNGQKSVKENFRDGYRHGNQIMYHSNGNLMSKISFVNGQRHGTAKTYYDNGQIESVLNYYYGVLSGTCEYYRRDGSQLKTMEYLMGDLNGWVTHFDENNNQVKKEFYWNDYQYEE